MYVSPTAVTTRGPAVAGVADADGRGSGRMGEWGVGVGELLTVTTTKGYVMCYKQQNAFC